MEAQVFGSRVLQRSSRIGQHRCAVGLQLSRAAAADMAGLRLECAQSVHVQVWILPTHTNTVLVNLRLCCGYSKGKHDITRDIRRLHSLSGVDGLTKGTTPNHTQRKRHKETSERWGTSHPLYVCVCVCVQSTVKPSTCTNLFSTTYRQVLALYYFFACLFVFQSYFYRPHHRTSFPLSFSNRYFSSPDTEVFVILIDQAEEVRCSRSHMSKENENTWAVKPSLP